MSSDCLDVQQILSMTNDGEPVGAEALKMARTHCATCSECIAFETTLKALRRQKPKALPDALVTRTMDAVDAEAAKEQARRAAVTAQDIEAAAATARDDAPTDGTRVVSGLTLPRTRKDWTTWGGWIAAAAVLLVVAGIATVRGAYFIAAPPSAQSESALRNQSDESIPESGLADGSTSDATKGTAAPTQAANAYVMFNGWVYASTGTAGPLDSTATTIGVVSSALNTGGSVLELSVFRGSTDKTLVIKNADESLLGFELVSRSFQGASYGLKSGPIDQFGQWPKLPTGIPQPDESDGSPVFERSITDDTGVAIYRRTGTSESSGFAIAPGTPVDDPAAGNPNWTWWEPFK